MGKFLLTGKFLLMAHGRGRPRAEADQVARTWGLPVWGPRAIWGPPRPWAGLGHEP